MIVPLLATAALLFIALLYRKLRYMRFRQYAHFPQHPTSLLLGHLKVFGDFAKRSKPDAHADESIVAMNQALGRPALMLIDMRPLNDPVLVVGDHDVADQLTKASQLFPFSPPKSSRSMERLMYMMGPTSIFSQHGEEWKLLRKRYNPGFAPQYLNTFVPEILDKGSIFVDRLDSLCKAGDNFSLMTLTTRLTFDIIGKVVMETDLDCQGEDQVKDGGLVDLFETLLDAYHGERLNLPWWLTPGKVRRRAALSDRITAQLQAIVSRKHAEIHGNNSANSANAARSVLSLGLQDIETMTPDILNETCDQLRTFLFAGHDTTSILISWALYELSRTPHALRAVRSELDGLLGSDASPAAARARMLESQEAVHRMPYISAVIKETLRLHPSGGTARAIAPGSGFSVRTSDGQRQCLDGLLVYNCQNIIHRDRRAYGESADDFVPERWLAAGNEQAADAIPAGAWRPFERGPRNCIGQELANMEARVILALTARRYDFVKTGLGALSLDEKGRPSLDEERGQYRVVEELYTTRRVTAKPVDGMMMKVKLVQVPVVPIK
ncbi:cytochrome P450 [Xylariaceae sp. FL0804]|nr:cytochrome P450 [Xylariaceae sp. FL0804]